ncbi:MAG: S-layer homology domain-containing protein, partial [Pseudoflavonifractor sp.]
SLYAGGGFTPGGTPWYRSAVDYGVAQGFLTRGEFADYAAPATRADMAGMFAFALPTAEYGRQNRVVSLPDVNTETKYCDEIYLLYSAGVLTGDETGAFHPNDGITRAEAAAIISRAALPQRRRTLHLSTMAGGTAVAAYDGASFRVTLPADWTCLPDPGDGLTQLLAQSADGMSNVLICRYAKSDLPGGDVGTAARSFLDAQAAQPGYLLTSPPAGALFRGLSGCAFSFALDGVPYRGWCVENGAAYFMLLLGGRETGLELLYTLDLSL